MLMASFAGRALRYFVVMAAVPLLLVGCDVGGPDNDGGFELIARLLKASLLTAGSGATAFPP